MTDQTKNPKAKTKISYRQQILVYAFLSLVTAISLNIVLPAYGLISASLGPLSASQLQQIVLMFILGMFGGELILGILSDQIGRRPVFILSVCIYLFGSLLCLSAANFTVLIIGRLIQGLGAAGQKVSLRAIVRDQYAGSAMARLTSIITMISVVVPFIAPLVGQSLARALGWKSIFVFLLLFGALCLLVFLTKQSETLTEENKNLQGWQAIVKACFAFLLNPHSLGYTLIAGLLFGIQLSYISLTPLFFSELFQASDVFVYCFGFISSAYGLALLVNSLVVMRWGMHRLVAWGLCGCASLGAIITLLQLLGAGLTLSQFVSLMFALLFGIGLVFGNIIAMAMEPLGQIAGLGGALSASISSLVALLVSYILGNFYHQTLLSFGLGIFLCALWALLILHRVKYLPMRLVTY